MTFVWTPYALPFLLASLVTAALAIHVSRHRDTAVGSAFLFVLTSIATWMLLESLIICGADVRTKLIVGRACYPPLMMIAPGLLVVAARANGAPPLRRWQWILVGSVPLMTLPILVFDPVPGVLYRAMSLDPAAPFARRLIDRGPWFHVIVVHSYALIAWATWLFVRRTRVTWENHRLDGALMLAGVAIPWVGVTLHILQLEPIPNIDAAPFGFVGMGVLLSIGFKRTGLLGVMGVGRRGVVDVMSDAVLVMDRRGLVLDANDAARDVLGLRDHGFIGMSAEQMLERHPGLVDAYRGLQTHGSAAHEIEISLHGRMRIFDLEISQMGASRVESTCHVLVLRDITKRRRAELALARESRNIHLIQQVAVAAHEAGSADEALEASLKLIADSMHWPVAQVCRPSPDEKGVLFSTSLKYFSEPSRFKGLGDAPAVQRVSGPDSMAVRALRTGRPHVVQLDPADDGPRARLAKRFGLQALLAMPVTLGSEVPAVLEFASPTPIAEEEELLGVFEHLGSLLGDVFERKRNEERIRELAYYDGLTGLPNRELFLRRLDRMLGDARQNDHVAALLFVDLDGFKRINDTLGHSAGDELLRRVSQRFSSDVRPSDVLGRGASEKTPSISRLGGDEFTVLLGRISAPQDAALVASRLQQSLSEPFEIAGAEVFVAASIGIAVFPHDAGHAEELLRNADAAMYAAKGTGTIEFYSESMNRESRRRLELEGLLRHALAKGELDLHYQPCRDTRTGEIVSVEALMRWERPEEGMISPAEFIPVAERSGLIIPLGDWALETACRQLVAWREAGRAPIRVAVNLSGVQIRHADLTEKVTEVLARTGLSACDLELEITETAIRADDPITQGTLQSLHELGVGLALDDFGTGTSSLTHLRRFPIQRVKIDRSFVAGIPDDAHDASLTAAIIAMAHGLGLSVVAEGVETEAQAKFLAERGCDSLQGFLLSRPRPANEIAEMLSVDEKVR